MHFIHRTDISAFTWVQTNAWVEFPIETTAIGLRGGGPVSKVLAEQAWGPEIRSPAPSMVGGTLCSPRDGQE